MSKKLKFLKVVSLNLVIFFIFILVFELFFGYWFKSQNFGIFIRDQRNINHQFDIIHNEQNYKYTFKRNSLGFIGEEIESKEIKVVFEAGSAGEQLFIPPNLRIVDRLNSFFKKDEIDLKIVNASTGGKTTKGYYNDFKNWFPKIKNFDPKIFIFYIGNNDAALNLPKHFDNIKRENYFDQVEDYIKNNSAIYEIKVKIQNRFFNETRKNYGLYKKNLYDNYKFVDYEDAKLKFDLKNLNDTEKKLLNTFEKSLLNLDKKIIESKVIPIFITQVRFDGISKKRLFIINESLKKFCISRNYYIIKLDEIIGSFEKGDFYDDVHTGIKGSEKISKIIYPHLKKILIKY